MKFQKLTSSILVIGFLCITYSCSNSSDTTAVLPTGNVAIKITSNINNTSSKVTDNKNFVINVTSFKLNIKNIELGIQNDESANFIIEGPYNLDISNGNEIIDIATITVPNDVYNKVKFNLHKEINNQNSMFEKSIEITGTIDGIPFEFWHNTENLVTVNLTDSSILTVNGDNTIAILNFDLNSLFSIVENYGINGVAPADTDRNDNGIIEINPNNDDGNGNVADIFLELIQANILLN